MKCKEVQTKHVFIFRVVLFTVEFSSRDPFPLLKKTSTMEKAYGSQNKTNGKKETDTILCTLILLSKELYKSFLAKEFQKNLFGRCFNDYFLTREMDLFCPVLSHTVAYSLNSNCVTTRLYPFFIHNRGEYCDLTFLLPFLG